MFQIDAFLTMLRFLRKKNLADSSSSSKENARLFETKFAGLDLLERFNEDAFEITKIKARRWKVLKSAEPIDHVALAFLQTTPNRSD